MSGMMWIADVFRNLF